MAAHRRVGIAAANAALRIFRAENERLRAERRERRERIATALLAPMLLLPAWDSKCDEAARLAIRFADALIAELDKEPAP